jgi:hypothetical protein
MFPINGCLIITGKADGSSKLPGWNGTLCAIQKGTRLQQRKEWKLLKMSFNDICSFLLFEDGPQCGYRRIHPV